MKRVRVVELFAGVGGFRLGLEAAGEEFVTVWSNQWEPGRKTQHASYIYEARFKTGKHSCEDIEGVVRHDFKQIPVHDLLVGGFPCQDYSVARTLSQAAGLIGKKGVLWWSIHRILEKMGTKSPKYLFLENVDRLIKSPASQRGRDFAVMLASLADLGYAVEWRVINAADYGFPQRRRRVFILGYKKGTQMYKKISAVKNPVDFLTKNGVLADAFSSSTSEMFAKTFTIEGTLAEISEYFSHGSPKESPFASAGFMIDREVATMKVNPEYSGDRTVLGDILLDEDEVPEEFFVNGELDRWIYLKGAKSEERKTKAGYIYKYSEGPVVFPDLLDKPSRTIVTGEGGRTPSRFKHVIKTESGRHRRLTPLELERLNMFPDDHTKLDGVSDNMRAFIMGNALVVGAIELVGRSLLKNI